MTGYLAGTLGVIRSLHFVAFPAFIILAYFTIFFIGESLMTLNNFIFRYSVGILLLVCLFTLGCGKYVKVSGTVTYSDTGESVEFGTVVFSSANEEGRGAINDGKYSVGRIKDGDGILPGTYTISSDSYPPPPQLLAPSMTDMQGNIVGPTQGTPTREREIYYTKEPQTIEIKKSMTYNLVVERGARNK